MITYNIEGEELTIVQIRKRVPAHVKHCTLRARLEVYQRRTWASLCEPANHRPRPEQRQQQPERVARPRMVLPAWPAIEPWSCRA